jgi:outer membrane lipoprotein LolB
VKPGAAALLVLAALLSGCATPPREPSEAAWTTGRMSLRVDASSSQPAHSLSAGFELRGTGTQGELHLNSPLGSRLLSARWQPGAVLLSTADGERRFDDLEGLSRAALGDVLPLAALPDWLAGRPWPEATHQPTDAGFEQLGWQVVLTGRGQGQVEARRVTAPAVLLRVRLDLDAP